MKKISFFIFIFLASQVQAQDPPDQAAVDEVNRLGQLLYEFDQAAWHGTDAVMPLLQAAGPDLGELMDGYVVEQLEDGWRVIFGRLTADSAAYHVAFEAQLDPDYEVISAEAGGEEETYTGFPAVAGHALAHAKEDFEAPEGVTYNTAVLPAENDDVFVYFLPAQPAFDVFYVGADFRYRYNPEKQAIVETKRLHNSVNTFDLREHPSAITMSTAVLTSIPTETDVFYAMSRPKGETSKVIHYVLAGDWVFVLDSTGVVDHITMEAWEKITNQ